MTPSLCYLSMLYVSLITYVKIQANAVSEGINRIIKIIKNRASGFHCIDAFSDIIYLVAGNVNIAEQIPVNNRTAYGGRNAL